MIRWGVLVLALLVSCCASMPPIQSPAVVEQLSGGLQRAGLVRVDGRCVLEAVVRSGQYTQADVDPAFCDLAKASMAAQAKE